MTFLALTGSTVVGFGTQPVYKNVSYKRQKVHYYILLAATVYLVTRNKN